jgi:hypothetical protein
LPLQRPRWKTGRSSIMVSRVSLLVAR